jgi:hypothetical protein
LVFLRDLIFAEHRAIASGGVKVLNQEVVRALNISSDMINAAAPVSNGNWIAASSSIGVESRFQR